MTDQEHLRQWLADRPFISVSAVSKAMGWKRGVLSEKLSGKFRKPLNSEELVLIGFLLEKYGYKK